MHYDISVIVTVFNVQKYLYQCIASIIAQKNISYEIIIIDDGSDDNSGWICDCFAAHNKGITVYHTENHGVAAARNVGIEKASGDWIMFVDGDDFLENSFFEKIDFSRYKNCNIVFFNTSVLLENGKILRPKAFLDRQRIQSKDIQNLSLATLIPDVSHNLEKKYPGMRPCTPWGKMYRLKYLIDNDLRFHIDLLRAEDNFFNFQVYLAMPYSYYDNLHSYVYRKNQTSISHKYNSRITTYYKKLILAFKEEINSIPDDKYRNGYYFMVLKSFMYCCGLDFCHRYNPKPYSERKRDFLDFRSMEEVKKAYSCIKLKGTRFAIRMGILLGKYRLFCLYNLFWKVYEYVDYNR